MHQTTHSEAKSEVYDYIRKLLKYWTISIISHSVPLKSNLVYVCVVMNILCIVDVWRCEDALWDLNLLQLRNGYTEKLHQSAYNRRLGLYAEIGN